MASKQVLSDQAKKWLGIRTELHTWCLRGASEVAGQRLQSWWCSRCQSTILLPNAANEVRQPPEQGCLDTRFREANR
jgi:hypothetical protein